MNDKQKENAVVIATAITIAVAAYAAGKVTGAVYGKLMTRKFNAAVDKTTSASK